MRWSPSLRCQHHLNSSSDTWQASTSDRTRHALAATPHARPKTTARTTTGIRSVHPRSRPLISMPKIPQSPTNDRATAAGRATATQIPGASFNHHRRIRAQPSGEKDRCTRRRHPGWPNGRLHVSDDMAVLDLRPSIARSAWKATPAGDDVSFGQCRRPPPGSPPSSPFLPIADGRVARRRRAPRVSQI